MNIIDALHDARVFRGQIKRPETWGSWEVYLRALFGLPIESAGDRRLFRQATGLHKAPARQFSESFCICGRRSGKSFISSLIAVYLACFKDWRPYLSPGEKGWIFILAVDKAQAGVIKNYISGIFRGVPGLSEMIAQETRETIELKGGVNISVKTASFRSLRGYTVIAAILEEIAFWRSDESANPDREVLAALRPALATVPDSLLIGISTPYSRQGVLWDQFKAGWGKAGGALIWKAPTRIMNPTINEKVIASALRDDYATAKAEWEAEWREDVQAFLSVELIEAAMVPKRYELPKIAGADYRAFCDPSGGRRDSMTLGIAHRELSGKIILDVIREIRPPFRPESAVDEFAKTMKDYGTASVRADRYAGEWVTSAFRDRNIIVENSELSASEIYLNFLPLVSNGSVELLDSKRLLAQLSGLERKTRTGGKDLIDHFAGSHDDIAIAAAGAITWAADAAVMPRIRRLC